MFRIILSDLNSKAFNRFLDVSRRVHLSHPYKRMDRIKEL